MVWVLIQPPGPACILFPATPKIAEMILAPRTVFGVYSSIKSGKFGKYRFHYGPIYATKTGQSTDFSDNVHDEGSASEIKALLYQAIEGINRGIFGVPSPKKSEIESLVKLLECQNPTPNPTEDLYKVCGRWKLIYSTISILGSKRTKLGLRDFITLGNFFQNIDIDQGKAVNMIEFNAKGLKMLNGHLKIEAAFKIASRSRVDIKFENATIIPDRLMNLFEKNYEILLGIFNPEGWLEISYVDESIRIGRDDKGNIFILERLEEDA